MTVVVPVHGGGRYAVEAIDSLLAQTYQATEVLVIDDGSPLPADQELVERYGKRIRYVRQPNVGLCATLNRALFELVETPLVARLDQDDVAAPERLGEQVRLLERDGADACLSRYWRTGPRGRRLAVHPDQTGHDFAYDPRRHGQIVHSTLLARLEFLQDLGGYDDALYPADDYDLSLRMHDAGTVVVHGAPLVDYRVHDASNTFSRFEDMVHKTAYLEERSRNADPGFPTWAEWRATHRLGPAARIRARGHFWYRQAGIAIEGGHYPRGATLLAGALITDPRRAARRLGNALRTVARR